MTHYILRFKKNKKEELQEEELQEKTKNVRGSNNLNFGESGYRSRYFPHAKRSII